MKHYRDIVKYWKDNNVTPPVMKDICINCGKEHESKLWGANCDCGNSNTVHQQKCSGCDNVMGQITDDDYCRPEKLYCTECLDKCRYRQATTNTVGNLIRMISTKPEV